VTGNKVTGNWSLIAALLSRTQKTAGNTGHDLLRGHHRASLPS
jgi:hypothetical protein